MMLALNFHRIEAPTGLEITRLTPRRFGLVLDEVGALGKSPNGSELTLTFDDGFASVAENALPRLQHRGWSALIFLITDAVGGRDDWDVRFLGRPRRMMTWDDARRWSAMGFEFGSHTCRHRDLTALSPRALRDELRISKARIEEATGTTVRCVSYPFGRHNERVRAAAREAGYAAGYAMTGQSGNEFAIPRTNVHSLMSLFELRRILRGGGPSWRTRLFTTLSAGSATVGNWRNHDTRGHQASTPDAAAANRGRLA